VNPWQGINRFLQVVWQSMRASARIKTWTPFLLYGLIQVLLAGWLYISVRPPWTDFTRLLPQFVIPEGFYSYPLHLLYIPSVLYNKLMIPAGLLLESLLMAAATWVFVRYAMQKPLPGLRLAIAEVRFGYGQYMLFWLLNYLLLLGYRYAFDQAFGDLWMGYERRRMLLDIANLGGGVALNALLAYATVIVVVERTAFGGSLKRTFQAFGRHWLATLTIVVLGTLMVYPSGYLISNAPKWIGRFNPEVMLAVLGLSIVLGMLATYFMAASLCFWYLMHRPKSA
jgi:hypothetical protein